MSGAIDREEYAKWSFHICGMACLKMLLAHWRKKVMPTIELMKMSAGNTAATLFKRMALSKGCFIAPLYPSFRISLDWMPRLKNIRRSKTYTKNLSKELYIFFRSS
ncbi:hypothetical protein QS257_20650 [Terrilactibacillus sp. S3-3]|nr:hypothetical protein QS257_20650 [Terrilactibacillus sp. S3-3]